MAADPRRVKELFLAALDLPDPQARQAFAIKCVGYLQQGSSVVVVAALAGLHRERSWKAQLQQLQQRLEDRIIIEWAKGVLVRRLGIAEEEAYQRLRVLSRRQRRPIRVIAQALLDTQSLLVPAAEEPPESAGEDGRALEQLLPPP